MIKFLSSIERECNNLIWLCVGEWTLLTHTHGLYNISDTRCVYIHQRRVWLYFMQIIYS